MQPDTLAQSNAESYMKPQFLHLHTVRVQWKEEPIAQEESPC